MGRGPKWTVVSDDSTSSPAWGLVGQVIQSVDPVDLLPFSSGDDTGGDEGDGVPPALFGVGLSRNYSQPPPSNFCKLPVSGECGSYRAIADRMRWYAELRAQRRANVEPFECHEPIKVALHGSEFNFWWPDTTTSSIANLWQCPVNCTAVNYVPTPTQPNDTTVDIMLVTNDGVGYLNHLTQPYQKLAVMTSEVHYGLSPASLNVTDILIHPRREADIWVNYYGYEMVKRNTDECISHPTGCLDVRPANILELWERSNHTYSGLFVSDCSDAEAGMRDWYIGMLQEIMKLDSFGKCHRNAVVPDWAKNITPFYEQKVQVLATYPFVFAFENQWVDDYVSEKFFQMFRMPGIGVYLGAPNAEEFAPGDNSFINVHRFENHTMLKRHLDDVLASSELQDFYMKWRTQPIRKKFIELAKYNLKNVEQNSFICRLCQFYSETWCL